MCVYVCVFQAPPVAHQVAYEQDERKISVKLPWLLSKHSIWLLK